MTSLYIDNPACLELRVLIACGSTVLITDAMVEATIYDPDDAPITGETWPLAMPFDFSDDVYRRITSSNLGLTEGIIYRVNIIAKDTEGDVLTDQDLMVRANNRRTT